MGDGDKLGLGLERLDDLLVTAVSGATCSTVIAHVGTPPISASTAVVLAP